MAKLRLAYGCKDDIQAAINNGTVPLGTMILTKDTNEMYFYTLDGDLTLYEERYKFSSKLEAEDWISRYDCQGSILSVRVGNDCQIYVVDYNNHLVKFESAAPTLEQLQCDWNEDDPTSPSFIRNKPDAVTGVVYTTDQEIESLFA